NLPMTCQIWPPWCPAGSVMLSVYVFLTSRPIRAKPAGAKCAPFQCRDYGRRQPIFLDTEERHFPCGICHQDRSITRELRECPPPKRMIHRGTLTHDLRKQ